jgi:hypothetical protein
MLSVISLALVPKSFPSFKASTAETSKGSVSVTLSTDPLSVSVHQSRSRYRLTCYQSRSRYLWCPPPDEVVPLQLDEAVPLQLWIDGELFVTVPSARNKW